MCIHFPACPPDDDCEIEPTFKVRQTKCGPNQYWVDVQRLDGVWVEMNMIPTTLNAVKKLRRLFAKED